MRKFLIFSFLFFVNFSFSQVSVKKEGNFIFMENGVLKISIDLKNGARISEYVYKPFEENIIYPLKSNGGLLMDHVWEQNWPGEFLFKKYNYKILKSGPDEGVVCVWRKGEKETTNGLIFKRTITMRRNDRVIHCKVSIENPTSKGKVIGYWNQNCFWFFGKENMIWYRPTRTGIDREGIDEKGNNWFSDRWYFVDDAISGWNGVVNKKLKMGMMFLMDYNDLWRIYDNLASVTTEWMYDRTAIPSKKTWSTDIFVIPVYDITGFTHGSKNILANMEITPISGGLEIEYQVTKSINPVKNITISTKIYGKDNSWSQVLPEIKLDELKDKVVKKTLKVKNIPSFPVWFEVKITAETEKGQIINETFYEYFGGTAGKNLNPYTMKPYFSVPKPKKQKVFLKPDVIKYTPNPEPKILFLKGLWWEFFKVEEAIKNKFPSATIVDGWLDSSSVGLSLTYFPPDYDTLTDFDLIILGNIPMEPVGLFGEEMIKDYLKAGGKLLILGGDQSFGQANFSNEELISLIPVEMDGKYNWRKIKNGKLILEKSSIIKNIKFKNEWVFYAHKCKPKPGSSIIVKTKGNNPIVVIKKLKSNGKIACILALPFGESKRGETGFWESSEWVNFMENLISWLLK